MKRLKLFLLSVLCWLLDHSWEYHQGKSRYITCRRCERLPKSQWETLCEMKQKELCKGT